MRCTKCGHKAIKRGHRQTKHAKKPIYHCKKCNRSFTPAKDHFTNKTYPARAIVSAITYYNLGHTLKETSKHINRRYKLKSSPTTIHSWITEFKHICTFSKIRTAIIKNNGRLENQIITRDFYHSGLTYTMKIHRPKLL